MRLVGLMSVRHSDFLNRSSFAALNGVRCASIVAVVWHHTGDEIPWLPASKVGFLGVDMFFVLSGFLIVSLLLRERDRNGSISLSKFYARRTLRIFPIYYGLLASLAVAFYWLIPEANMAKPFFAELPFYATYTSNWIHSYTLLGITWSLAAEEQFYLLWPPVERWLRAWTLPILFCVLLVNQLINFRVADGWLFRTIGYTHEDLPILQSTFTPICLGVLVAHILHRRRGFDRLAGLIGNRFAGPILCGLLIAICNIPIDLSGWPRLSIHILMAALLGNLVMVEDQPLVRLLSWGPVARIGIISYGIYLYHLFVRHAAVEIVQCLPGYWPGSIFVVCLALTILISELSFRFFETPIIGLKRYFASQESRA